MNSRQLDWAIDIVTDNEIDASELPTQLQKMVEGSITTRSLIRLDSLGLPYPGVKPIPCSGATIKEVVVKSVIEYALNETDYVVELTLFRSWLGSDTRGDPILSTGVAMYHKDWDDEMGRLTATAGDRSWAEPLKTFFGKGFEKDELDIGSNGIERFIAEIEMIQDLLVEATTEAETLRKIRIAEAEAMQEQLQELDIEVGADTNTEVAQESLTETQHGDEAAGDDHSRTNSVDFPLLDSSSGTGPPTQNNTNEVENVYEDIYSAD